MGKTIFYKPELNKAKATLIARCLTHCLTCEDISLSLGEQGTLLQFCAAVGERDFVDSTLQRIERLKGIDRVKTIEALQETVDEEEEETALPIEVTDFESWTDLDDLKHRLYEHEDNYARGQLSEDDLLRLKARIKQL